MTIEEIEKEWEESKSPGPDCYDSEFALKYMGKLIAVAKAAKNLFEDPNREINSWGFKNLYKTLEELEKE